MSQELTIRLSDEAFAKLRTRAEEVGMPIVDYAAKEIETWYGILGSSNGHATHNHSDAESHAARIRFESHFGSVRVGHPHGVDNDLLDANLAHEIDNHGDG